MERRSNYEQITKEDKLARSSQSSSSGGKSLKVRRKPVFFDSIVDTLDELKKNPHEDISSGSNNIINVFQRLPGGKLSNAHPYTQQNLHKTANQPTYTTNVVYEVITDPQRKYRSEELETLLPALSSSEEILEQINFSTDQEVQLYHASTSRDAQKQSPKRHSPNKTESTHKPHSKRSSSPKKYSSEESEKHRSAEGKEKDKSSQRHHAKHHFKYPTELTREDLSRHNSPATDKSHHKSRHNSRKEDRSTKRSHSRQKSSPVSTHKSIATVKEVEGKDCLSDNKKVKRKKSTSCCRCHKENCTCSKPHCDAREKSRPKEKKPSICKCEKEYCKCKELHCKSRDKKPKPDLAPQIAPVHRNTKKIVTSPKKKATEPQPAVPNNVQSNASKFGEPTPSAPVHESLPQNKKKYKSPIQPLPYAPKYESPQKSETPKRLTPEPPKQPSKPPPQRNESPIQQLQAPPQNEPGPPTPQRYESPIRQVQAPQQNESGPPTPQRHESSVRQLLAPQQNGSGPPTPQRLESPIQQVQAPPKNESGPTTPQRYESLIRQLQEPPQNEIAPPTPQRYESPIRLTELPLQNETLAQSTPIYESPVRQTQERPRTPPQSTARFELPFIGDYSLPQSKENPQPIPQTLGPPKPCLAEKSPMGKQSSRPILKHHLCPQPQRPHPIPRSSISKKKIDKDGYEPIWYQRTGKGSEEWLDGGAYYETLLDPSNQIGAFAPNVNVENMVLKEKKRRGIENMLPYSNEDFSNKGKTPKLGKRFKRSNKGKSSGASSSNNIVMNLYKTSHSSKWNFDVPTKPKHRIGSRPVFDAMSPHICIDDIDPYLNKPKPVVPTESSVYNVSSVSSGAVNYQVYSATFTYDQPCNCGIDNCECLYVCSSRKNVNKPKFREMTTRDKCVNPSDISACSRGRPSSRRLKAKKSVDTMSSEYSLSSRGGGRSFVFLRRGMSEGDTIGECFCKTADCHCIYEPCASRERRVRRIRKVKARKEFKKKKAKHLDEDKCILCQVKAIERPFSWCMRTCCITWVWHDREFKRHCGRELGPLPEYREKPASLNESWLQRTWNKRYTLDEGDGDSVSLSTITTA